MSVRMQRATFSLVVTHSTMRCMHGLGSAARCPTIKILLFSRIVTAGRRKLFDLHTTEVFTRYNLTNKVQELQTKAVCRN